MNHDQKTEFDHLVWNLVEYLETIGRAVGATESGNNELIDTVKDNCAQIALIHEKLDQIIEFLKIPE